MTKNFQDPGKMAEEVGNAPMDSPSSVQKRAVWLDCDPGHDDALAIMLAAHSPALTLLGISTVHGNQTVEKVTRNAVKVLHLCGRSDIDVVQGAGRALMRPVLKTCPEIHGSSGLDGPLWSAPARAPDARAAVHVIYNAITRHYAAARLAETAAAQAGAEAQKGGGEEVREQPRVALVCTAALTNIALLLSVHPDVIPLLEGMGGGAGRRGAALKCDPEAAHIVMESGARVTMVPLEVTHTALVTPPVLARILAAPSPPTPFRTIVGELLTFFAKRYKEVFGFEHPPLHDPCAVAFVIAPHIFKLSAGQTVCDVWRQSGRPPNVTLTRSMDVAAFWELLVAALDRANAASPLNCSPKSGKVPQ
eukprot:jgi/Mesen1/9760/ME000007S09820